MPGRARVDAELGKCRVEDHQTGNRADNAFFCVVVITGNLKPSVVEVTSTMALAAGVPVPMPIKPFRATIAGYARLCATGWVRN